MTLFKEGHTADEDGMNLVDVGTMEGGDGGREIFEQMGDLGVEEFVHKLTDNLAKGLMFPNCKPPMFSMLRLISGKAGWGLNSVELTEDDADAAPLRLLWHQLVGVSSIVKKLFVEHRGLTKVPGLLLVDNVGLGKTAKVMAVIATIIQVQLGESMEHRV